MPRLRTTTTLALPLAMGLAALAGGCGYPADGNPLASNDEYNYVSTSTMPQTVVLRDLRTDEVLRTWEIPVNQKVYIRFYPERAEPITETTPDTCEWIYYPIALSNPPAENHVRFNVPAANSRRLDLFLRPSPELPADMKPADVPMPPSDLPPIK
jgi:hypothetical protein